MADGVVIVDYGAGNLRSAEKAFARMVQQTDAGLPVIATSDSGTVARASHIVLPGQGAFAACRAGLHAVDGMVDALTEAVLVRGMPFLGICVGMQLLADRGLEYGETPGLGWIPGDVAALAPADRGLKIPHMGWNDLTFHDADRNANGSGSAGRHPVLAGLEDGGYRQQEVGAGFNQVRESRKIGVAILIEPGNVEYVQEYAGVDDDDARQRVQGQSRQPACVRSSFSQARARSFR